MAGLFLGFIIGVYRDEAGQFLTKVYEEVKNFIKEYEDYKKVD